MSRQPMRHTIGFIYFFHSPALGMVKIGYTTNPNKRFAACQATSPDRLELLGCIVGDRLEETRLHSHFAAHRAHYEWFAFSEEIAEYVRERARPYDQLLEERDAAIARQERQAKLATGTWSTLRELIEAHADGRKLSDIAKAAGMSTAGLNNIISGHNSKPTLDSISRILKALNAGIECWACRGTCKCQGCKGKGFFPSKKTESNPKRPLDTI